MTEQFQRSDEHFSRPAALGGGFVLRQQESQMPKLKTKSGAKKRFKVTATGKVMHAQRGKPRHDQADQEADPPAPRHPRAVQDRWRQRQEILLAERLTGRGILKNSQADHGLILPSRV